MNKAVLVIDMPKNCIHCPCLHRYDNDDWCAVACKVIYSPSNRDKHCPLKPMPEKQLFWHDDERDAWAIGYNDCIEDILEQQK